MKKTLSVLLAIITLFSLISGLNLTAFANPTVKSINLQLAEIPEVQEFYNGVYHQDSNGDTYFLYTLDEKSFLYQEGNTLTITLNDNTVKTFTYDGLCYRSNDYEFPEDYTGVNFPMNSYETEYDYRQTAPGQHWSRGVNYIYFTYCGKELKIPVRIAENNVKSISVDFAGTVINVQNSGGYYTTDTNGQRYYKYTNTDTFAYPGNVLTITYKDNSKDTFTCRNGYYFNADGESLIDVTGVYIESYCFSDDQNTNHWGVGTHYRTLNYLGKEIKCPVIILNDNVKSIQPSVSEIRLTTNDLLDLYYDEKTDTYATNYGSWEDKLFSSGNSITVNFTDGTSDVYTAGYYYNSRGIRESKFVNSDGNPMGLSLELCYDDQAWVEGSEITLTLSYGNSTASIPIVMAKGSNWIYDYSNWIYLHADGSYQKGWLNDGGKWYFFDADGNMQTGWVKSGNAWYYMNKSGAMVTGWQKIGSVWYYFKSSGAMVTGWQKVGSTWYYFKSSGAMATGWQKVGSTWYYFQGSGAMQTGWLKSGGKWYYFNASGTMLASTSQRINGKTYKFNSSGACINP